MKRAGDVFTKYRCHPSLPFTHVTPAWFGIAHPRAGGPFVAHRSIGGWWIGAKPHMRQCARSVSIRTPAPAEIRYPEPIPSISTSFHGISFTSGQSL